MLAKFKEVEALVPILLGESTEISKTIKGFFTNTRKTLEEYINGAEKGEPITRLISVNWKVNLKKVLKNS